MRKSRQYKRPKIDHKLSYRRNEQIDVPEVRLIDEDGGMIGIVSIGEALRMSKERELDLIEVYPKAVPPVVKIIDFGKFQYQQEKLAQKQRAKAKQTEIKGLRISLRISDHDLETRKNQAKAFLAEGNKVMIELILKGRERQYTAMGQEALNSFAKDFSGIARLEQPFNNQGGRLTILIAPK